MSKDGTLPSYEESVDAKLAAQHSTSSTGDDQHIRDRVRAVREKQIASVINQHVYPWISQEVMNGIGNIAIALIPSDVVLLQDKTVTSEFDFDPSENNKVEIVGFSEQPHQIQLEGHMNRLDFWKQKGVLEELERALIETLDSSPQPSEQMEHPQPSLPPRPVKKGFFGLMSSPTAPETSISGRRSEPPKRENNILKLSARLEEICLRTVSAFGLYETITRQGIIVRVSVA